MRLGGDVLGNLERRDELFAALDHLVEPVRLEEFPLELHHERCGALRVGGLASLVALRLGDLVNLVDSDGDSDGFRC